MSGVRGFYIENRLPMMYAYHSSFFFLAILAGLLTAVCYAKEVLGGGIAGTLGFAIFLICGYGITIIVFEDMVKRDMFRINICPEREPCQKCAEQKPCPSPPEVCVVQYMQQPTQKLNE